MQVARRLSGMREVNVSFVHDYNRVRFFVREQVFNFLARRYGSGRIIRIADIVRARVRIGLIMASTSWL